MEGEGVERERRRFLCLDCTIEVGVGTKRRLRREAAGRLAPENTSACPQATKLDWQRWLLDLLEEGGGKSEILLCWKSSFLSHIKF